MLTKLKLKTKKLFVFVVSIFNEKIFIKKLELIEVKVYWRYSRGFICNSENISAEARTKFPFNTHIVPGQHYKKSLCKYHLLSTIKNVDWYWQAIIACWSEIFLASNDAENIWAILKIFMVEGCLYTIHRVSHI